MNQSHPSRLAGRRIIVTGAAAGMGRAIVERFTAEGARIAAIDIDATGLAGIGDARQALDITDIKGLAKAVDTLADVLGGLDGVVNAAGILRTARVEDTDESLWRRINDVNLMAPAQLCRFAVSHLRRAGGGTIVNVASLGGLRPNATMSAYAASKGGLIAFTKVLAAELAIDNIRANALCPGFIATAMTDALYIENPSQRDVTLARLSMNRAGTPEEIAAMALFLSCDESSFTTGAVLTADGGSGWH
ncbi:SDR family NAD(P)-dependent oxidoreductase [uncultured Sphingomonas sp.]|uniref:SDR family NAD(P)-dependent oxidoreductase n=1 Tax=uncultured Sphingomonas sp. TaxID=158754 RepID=UPI00263984C5|nr:SDR family NAD(P)-dependent oxidoreductase [uncultured Sphingomonas sp.]